MNITEFLQQYAEKQDKDRFVKKHVTTSYIPIEAKQLAASNIVKGSYYLDGEFHVNSVAKYMLTKITLFDLYTDIERSDGTILADFNALNEARFFDVLESAIDEKEIVEFYEILEMECEDAKTNEYELGGFIRRQVERFGNLLGTALVPILEQQNVQELLGDIKNKLDEVVAKE